ncbi:MAG: secondary thiamine-phosphate synthase enzyme YjbQ [Cyanobium sp.]
MHVILSLDTQAAVACHDITAELNAHLAASGLQQGVLVAVAQHTTTALVINEAEERLMADIANYFSSLVRADHPWLHNDLHLRDVPPDEPRNAHSHLIALMLGSQLSVPIVGGRLGLGRYQSVMLVELDGPRPRQVLVQLLGTQNCPSSLP